MASCDITLQDLTLNSIDSVPKYHAELLNVNGKLAESIIGSFYSSTFFKVAKRGVASMQDILTIKNVVDGGEICFDGKWVTGRHKPLIDLETFNRVQAKINHKVNKVPKYLSKHGAINNPEEAH